MADLLLTGRSARSIALQLGLPVESMKRHARHARPRAGHLGLVSRDERVIVAPPAVSVDPLWDLLDELLGDLDVRYPQAPQGGPTAAVREALRVHAARTVAFDPWLNGTVDRAQEQAEPSTVAVQHRRRHDWLTGARLVLNLLADAPDAFLLAADDRLFGDARRELEALMAARRELGDGPDDRFAGALLEADDWTLGREPAP